MLTKLVNGVPAPLTEAEEAAFYNQPPRVIVPDDVIRERDRHLVATAAGYTRTERETWPVQVEEAKAFKADNTSPTPMLSRLAAARGLMVDQMADRVLALNASFADMTGAIMAAATVLVSQDPIPEDYKEAIHWP